MTLGVITFEPSCDTSSEQSWGYKDLSRDREIRLLKEFK